MGGYKQKVKNNGGVNNNINIIFFSYNTTLTKLLGDDNPKLQIFIATHNFESIKFAKEIMEKDIKLQQRVYFAQLYGMCDFIAEDLGNEFIITLYFYKLFAYSFRRFDSL